MTKMIAVFALALLLTACAGDGSSSDIRKQAKEALQNAPQPTPAPTAVAEAAAGNIRFFTPNAGLAAGATQCYDVKVADFKNILATQYTLQWDKNVLAFAGLKEFKLPYMSNENFGLSLAPNGTLTAVWIDNSLKGVTVPDNGAIYQICFKAVGKSGQSSAISVTGSPTAIEVVTVGDQVWGIKASNGRITIE
jgi:hypothetical protein